MSRSLFALAATAAAITLAACDSSQPPDPPVAAPRWLDASREQLDGDIYHYTLEIRVGDTPNARLRLHRVVRERAPWVARPAHDAVMLLHGDFSTFTSNFAPAGDGLAVYLARRGIDVWGFDRRWASAPADADLSDFDAMGLAQELGDISHALAVARSMRILTGAGGGRMRLIGFSRGGLLAYAYTAAEAARPWWTRHVDGLVPIDVYAEIAPEDDELRQLACDNAELDRQALAEGVVDAENSFVIGVGELALSAPDDPSPFFEGSSNREALLVLVSQTYFFVPFTPLYHLAAGVIEDEVVTALRDSDETVIATWFADAAPHQSMREAADTDALWCGETSIDLGRITVPLFYLGAAGGFGDHGLHSTTLVGSTDVTTLVVRRFDADREAEDFGHADLLFAAEAPALAWQPLASWIRAH